MKSRVLLSAALLLSASSLSAFAAATPEEAQRIKASLEAYLSATPGVVTVTPDGNAYTISLDASPFFAKITDPTVKAFAEPYKMKAEPMGNGQWTVSGTGPWGFQFNAADKATFSLRIGDQNWSGTYDEALAAFTKSTGTFSNLGFSQSVPDPSGNTMNVVYTIQSITADGLNEPDGTGAVNTMSNMVMSNITTSTTITGADGQPAGGEAAMMNYSLASPKLTYTTSGKSVTYRPLLDLMAFFVERPDKQLIINDQALLKQKLKAALPLFKSVAGSAAYEGLTVTTAMGQFGAAKLSADANMNGLVADGFFQERFALSGFTMPAGIAPPWAQELVPANMSLDFSLKGFNLDAPAQLVLGQLDLSKPEPLPAGFEGILLPATLPSNSVTISLGNSEISNALYSITYDGEIVAGLAGLPTGKATVRMKGMDGVIAKLQAGGADPNVQQMMAGLIGIKGFGKAEADGSLIWAIDATTPGKVLVNGVDVSAMLGMAPPPQQ